MANFSAATGTATHPATLAAHRAVSRLLAMPVKHHVSRLTRSGSHYHVRSGRSGNLYRVTMAIQQCSCIAGQRGRTCDHLVAAITTHNAIQAMQAMQSGLAGADDVRYYARAGGQGIETTVNGITV